MSITSLHGAKTRFCSEHDLGSLVPDQHAGKVSVLFVYSKCLTIDVGSHLGHLSRLAHCPQKASSTQARLYRHDRHTNKSATSARRITFGRKSDRLVRRPRALMASRTRHQDPMQPCYSTYSLVHVNGSHGVLNACRSAAISLG